MKFKKCIIILLLLFLSVSLSACDVKTNVNQENHLKIQEVLLTKEEKNILTLFGLEKNSKIYHYDVDEKAKSIKINLYRLDEKLNWKEQDSSFLQIEDKTGKIAITISDNQAYRVSVQNESCIITWILNSHSKENSTNKNEAICWQNKSDIMYEKENPLVIQIVTKENKICTFVAESFFDTERLKEHDNVFALTVTFSQNELE